MLFFAMAIGTAVISSVVGDFYVKQGSSNIETPPVESFGGLRGLANPVRLHRFIRASRIFPRKLKIGIALLTLFFVAYIAAVNSAPVSLVAPLMSSTHVLSTLMGKYALHERVSPLRWAGVLVVVLGVSLLASTSREVTGP